MRSVSVERVTVSSIAWLDLDIASTKSCRKLRFCFVFADGQRDPNTLLRNALIYRRRSERLCRVCSSSSVQNPHVTNKLNLARRTALAPERRHAVEHTAAM